MCLSSFIKEGGARPRLVKSYNSVFDIVKFILAIAVVAIHSQLLPGLLFPWLRLAVPMFFMISSYLFFDKLKDVSDQKERKAIILNFVLRNLILYLFWFIALLPVTIFLRQYFVGSKLGVLSVCENLLCIVRDFLFGSTFRASWFIMALVIAVVLVSWLSKRLNNIVLLCGSLFIYIMIVLRSGYISFFSETSFVYDILCFYETYLSVPYLSFPVALVWVVCGKCFAEYSYRYIGWINVFLIVFFSFCLYIEWDFLKVRTGHSTYDCYFFLFPVVVCVFSLLNNICAFSIKTSLLLRKYSVIIYALHGSVTFLLSLVIESSFQIFYITLVFCLFVAWIVCILERFKGLRWLRYAH